MITGTIHVVHAVFSDNVTMAMQAKFDADECEDKLSDHESEGKTSMAGVEPATDGEGSLPATPASTHPSTHLPSPVSTWRLIRLSAWPFPPQQPPFTVLGQARTSLAFKLQRLCWSLRLEMVSHKHLCSLARNTVTIVKDSGTERY